MMSSWAQILFDNLKCVKTKGLISLKGYYTKFPLKNIHDSPAQGVSKSGISCSLLIKSCTQSTTQALFTLKPVSLYKF